MGRATTPRMTDLPAVQETETEILSAATAPSPADLTKARRFLESCTFTTAALGALVVVLRQQYDGAREAGCEVVDGYPCADLLASILPALAAAEAREI